MSRFQVVATVMCSCLMISAMSGSVLLADTWTSADGNYTVDAEFVQLADGKVQLKRNDNQELIWVALTDLAEADRSKAKRLATAMADAGTQEETQESGETDSGKAVANTTDSVDAQALLKDAQALLKKVKVSSELKYDTMIMMGSDGKEEPKRLKVIVVAKGGPAASAFRYGKLNIESFVDDSGKPMTMVTDDFSMDNITEDMMTIDRSNTYFESHPKDGVGVPILVSGKGLPKSIKELSGSFMIETGGERSTVAIKDLTDKRGKQLESEELSKRGIEILLSEKIESGDGEQLSFEVTSKGEHLIDVFVGDKNKKPLEQQNGSSVGGFGDQMVCSFYFDGKVPANAVLHVELVDNPTKLKIPFSLKNLKVPKQK